MRLFETEKMVNWTSKSKLTKWMNYYFTGWRLIQMFTDLFVHLELSNMSKKWNLNFWQCYEQFMTWFKLFVYLPKPICYICAISVKNEQLYWFNIGICQYLPFQLKSAKRNYSLCCFYYSDIFHVLKSYQMPYNL